MKIGVYCGWDLPDPASGSGYTFEYSLLQELERYRGKHTFYVFYKPSPRLRSINYGHARPAQSHLHFVPLQKFLSSPQDSFLKKIYLKFRRLLDKRKNIPSSHPLRYGSFASYSGQALDFVLRTALRAIGVKINHYKSFLDRAAHKKNIEVMWFMTPNYQPVTIPFIYTVWDLQHRLQSYFPEVSVTGSSFEQREKHYASIIPKASYIIAGNHTGKHEVATLYNFPAYRIKTLELPPPQLACFEDKNITSSILKNYKITTPYLFYPAQFWPHKNHIALLHTLNILQKKYQLDFSLVLTGSDKGNKKYIQDQAHLLSLENNVHFLGFVSIQELIALYRHAFALTFASFFGPNNIPPLEAFSLGCPVIAADVAGAQEQLGTAALFFDPRKPEACAEQVARLLHNQALKKIMIAKGKAHVQQWTTKHYLDKLITIIDEFEPIRRCWSSNKPYIHL